MKTPKLFEISECLDSDEQIFAFLEAVLEEKDINLLILSMGHIAKAKGFSMVANADAIGGAK